MKKVGVIAACGAEAITCVVPWPGTTIMRHQSSLVCLHSSGLLLTAGQTLREVPLSNLGRRRQAKLLLDGRYRPPLAAFACRPAASRAYATEQCIAAGMPIDTLTDDCMHLDMEQRSAAITAYSQHPTLYQCISATDHTSWQDMSHASPCGHWSVARQTSCTNTQKRVFAHTHADTYV